MHPVARVAIPTTALLLLTFSGICVAGSSEPDGYIVAPFDNESSVRALDWMASDATEVLHTATSCARETLPASK